MILGIDAANIRADGGMVHLVELLGSAEPAEHGFAEVIVWGGRSTLSRIKDRPWLVKRHQPALDRSLPFRAFWQHFRLTKLARVAGCDVLFVPGGVSGSDFSPMVALSQNILPFELRELRRFGWSWLALKLLLLRGIHIRTFHRADGLIFLTAFAGELVGRALKQQPRKIATIAHGVHERFVCPPREQLAISSYSTDRPFRILYVSKVYPYKHQGEVLEAVGQLRARGLPVRIDFVGSGHLSTLKRLKQTLGRLDPDKVYARYVGDMPHEELARRYFNADLFVFASSCETFALIVVEAMSAGLPIACSNHGTVREVVGEGGLYFDPEDPRDIARALQEMIESTELRTEKARAVFRRAKMYSWKRCATDTFSFLASVAQDTTHKGRNLPR